MAQPVGLASVPVLKSLIDEARLRDYRHGVLGVRARPVWSVGATFTHGSDTVRVVPCVSALAVREALVQRPSDGWLVVLTDRDDEDLGAGVLSHLVWHRLRTPDPWEAVKHKFAATGLDPALTAAAAQRDLAAGLLAASPAEGWPPARGGVLTRDHALTSVARAHLRFDEPEIDDVTVLTWTARPASVGWLADLRQLAGDALTDEVLTWIARRLGAAGPAVLKLLRDGRGLEALPIGLVAGVLYGSLTGTAGEDAATAAAGFIRLEATLGKRPAAEGVARVWGAAATSVLGGLLHDSTTRSDAERLLTRADAALDGLDATALAARSDLLPSGLTRRLARLADTLQQAVGTSASDSDLLRVTAPAASAVEQAWVAVEAHRLADTDRRTPAFRGAVRLVRWLTEAESTATPGIAGLVARHRDDDGWVDSAVNDVFPGVGEADLGAALEVVLTAVQRRRRAHDDAFATALVAHTADEPAALGALHAGVAHLEDLMRTSVLPLAQQTPVLFLLLDGMSVGVSTEVVADILAHATDGWLEAALSGNDHRGMALAVLPTLTEISRASLFTGALTRGGQSVEVAGHAAQAASFGVTAILFHKKPIDSSRPGHAVADDVGAAVDDVTGVALVTCVLNTIDDALDRSDPGGTEWGAETVKNLRPLLDRARRAGRTVVITADHGHVVERRQGTMRSYPLGSISSGRSRAAEPAAAAGEVLIQGRRVVTDDHRAVLAVDERVRFGPLKAGYHGGASAAEVIVPVILLVPGEVPTGSGLTLMRGPAEPPWWEGPPLPELPVLLVQPTPLPAGTRASAPDGTLSLFDEPVTPVATAPASPSALVAAVVGSSTYRAQASLAPRRVVSDEDVAELLSALLSVPSRRLTGVMVAQALKVQPARLRGAFAQVQQLLNVDSYAVLSLDVDGSTVVLDESLLRDQFEVPG